MNIKSYAKESYNELVNKVTWPAWSELQNSAIVVMIASFIISVIIYMMDISFSTIMDWIYNLGK